EFTNAVKDGLQGSGHQKLDLLDWDACMMGADGAVKQASQIANNLVASSEIETPNSYKGGGQNLPAVLNDLIHNPSMNGQQLAQDFVGQAKKGANERELYPGEPQDTSGTSTLASYDLTKADQFTSKLNQFAENLKQAVQSDPQQKQLIQELV